MCFIKGPQESWGDAASEVCKLEDPGPSSLWYRRIKLGMAAQVYKPSAAKVETGGFLGLSRQPSLVGEFQTSDKLLLRDTNKTSGLHNTHM